MPEIQSFCFVTKFVKTTSFDNGQKIRTSWKQSSTWVQQTTLIANHYFFISFSMFASSNDKCERKLFFFKSLFSSLIFLPCWSYSYTFFRNSEFHALCTTIFSRMNCSSQISYNIMVSYFKWRHSLSYGKIPFTLRKCIHVCAITSHKIHLHLPLKFIEIDETSVNLLHNYSKSGCNKLQKFQ